MFLKEFLPDGVNLRYHGHEVRFPRISPEGFGSTWEPNHKRTSKLGGGAENQQDVKASQLWS